MDNQFFTATTGPLSGYRILDLTDRRGLLAGQILARLGAEVIQVEPLGGSPARQTLAGKAGPSWFWEAYAAGKQSVTCDLENAAGRALFARLAGTADILIESEEPGVMARRGLAWPWLHEVNPKAIHVTITGFGSDGPKAGYAESDLIVWAAGGPLFANRDGDSPPLRISVPQSYRHAAVDAAGGALMALFARHATGLGQHVDISAQQSVAQATLSSILASTVGDENFSVFEQQLKRKKTLDLSGSGARTRRSKWEVADGLVEFHLAMGQVGWSTNNLFAWMREESALPEQYASWDWTNVPARIENGDITDEEMEKVREVVAMFIAPMTKQRLLEEGLARRITVAPIATTQDILQSPHFAARECFDTVSTKHGHITLPARFALCEGFVKLTPAPALGEDNARVYGALSGRDEAALWRLAENGNNMSTAPLAGLKVLDFCWVVAGPMIGRALADFGATVVRVESSQRFDPARVMGPFPDGTRDLQKSLLFENCNAGKFGLALDMSRPEGLDVARDLARWSDVVIESFAPGQMTRWKLDYETLSADHPELVMVSTSLMGQAGPYSRCAGFGNIGGAFSGFQALAGQTGKRPIGPFGPYTDYVGPKFGIVMLLAALDQARTTGQGRWIDLSQVEATLQCLAPEIAECSVTGKVAEPNGNRDPSFAPHGVFRCRGSDEWIAITVRDDDEWRRFAAVIGGAGLEADPRFSTLERRKVHEDELEAVVTGWTAGRAASEVERRLQDLAIPAHVVASSADFCADPQIAARGHLRKLPHGSTDEVTVEGSRFRLSDTPAEISRCAPSFGRDNRHVLRSFAGYDDPRIDALEAAGVLK